MKKLLLIPVVFFIINCQSQEMKLPYHQIPEAPEEYTAGNVVGRLIDGLGYRYHWATKDLTQDDLSHKITKEGRSIIETLQHIYGMSETILEAPKGEPSIRPQDFSGLSYHELRSKTLANLKAASEVVKGKTNEEVSNFKITFDRGGQQTDFPYWNMLNGMISDCIYHTGQIVLMRRSNGNPIDPNVNVFLGKNRE